jgi:hypothetical protein
MSMFIIAMLATILDYDWNLYYAIVCILIGRRLLANIQNNILRRNIFNLSIFYYNVKYFLYTTHTAECDDVATQSIAIS